MKEETISYIPTILLVDDDSDIRSLQKRFLKNEHAELLEAGTGEECIRIVNDKKPDLVVLDINLPDKSGIEICREIKFDKSLSGVFILFASARNVSNKDIEEGYNSGAEGYIAFPYTEGEFLARIRSIMRIVIAEHKLKESEARFKSYIEFAPDGFFVTDEEGICREVNQAAVNATGYTKRELMKMSFTDLLVKDQIYEHGFDMMEKLQKGSSLAELMYTRKDGQTGTWLVGTTGLNEEERMISVKDITEKKYFENKIIQSGQDYKTIFSQSHDIILIFDPQNEIILDANLKAVETYGFSREELIGMSLRDLSTDINGGIRKIEETIKKGQISNFISVQKNKLGEEIIFEINASIIDFRGKDAVLSSNHNITNKIKLEHENNLIKFSVERANASIFWITPEGKFFYVNETASDQLGYEKDEIIGSYIWNLDRNEVHEKKNRKERWELLKENQSMTFDSTHMKKDGTEYPVRVTSNYFNYEGKEFEFAFATDITQLKEIEAKLNNYTENLEEIVNQRKLEVEKQARKLSDSQKALTYLLEDVNDSRDELKATNAELEAVNKELESFSYSVSHDLRAPLTRMDGFSKAIMDKYSDVLDDEGKHYLHRIRASSQIMAQLINELLTLSRITRKELKKEEVDLSKIALNLIEDIKKSDKKGKIKFEIENELIVLGDKTLLTFLLENLLSNAFKFTFKKNKGNITLGKTQINDENVIYIRDTGVGFNMKYYDKLFVAFQRLHSNKEFEGTGIGLATVMRIINRHGGAIWAESELDVGTTFYFTV